MEYLYVLSSTKELYSCLFNSTEEHLIQSLTMIDIAPPISIIDTIHQHKTHSPCRRMLSVTLTPSLRCQRHQWPPSQRTLMYSYLPPISIINAICWSSLFISPLCPLSVPCVDAHTLRFCPLSMRICGTTFLSFIAELLPKIGTQSKIERK